jgi:hypothetical protein
MLTRKTLQRINDSPRQVNRLPLALVGVGSLALAALLFLFTSSLVLALAPVAAGALGVLVAYRSQKAKTLTTLTYGDLQGERKARYSEVREGCEALAASEKVWRLSAPAGHRGPKAGGDAAPPPAREPARVGTLEMPGIRADIPIWGIEAGEYATVYFFPEAVLLYRDGRYQGFSYESLEVSIFSSPFYEREAVPEDVKVVTERTARSQMPVVLYTLVGLGFPRGPEVRLMVSSRQAAARFVKAFGVESRKSPRGAGEAWGSERRREEGEESKESERTYYDSLTMKERARIASAYTTLGVRKGASMSEVIAAYKQLARVHHPDKVAPLEPEERELSERRMKEINAAYTELKRLWRNLF